MVFSTLCRTTSTSFCSDNTTIAKEIDGPLRPSLATPQRHNEGSSLERSLLYGVVVVFLGFLSPKRTSIFLAVLLCSSPQEHSISRSFLALGSLVK